MAKKLDTSIIDLCDESSSSSRFTPSSFSSDDLSPKSISFNETGSFTSKFSIKNKRCSEGHNLSPSSTSSRGFDLNNDEWDKMALDEPHIPDTILMQSDASSSSPNNAEMKLTRKLYDAKNEIESNSVQEMKKRHFTTIASDSNKDTNKKVSKKERKEKKVIKNSYKTKKGHIQDLLINHELVVLLSSDEEDAASESKSWLRGKFCGKKEAFHNGLPIKNPLSLLLSDDEDSVSQESKKPSNHIFETKKTSIDDSLLKIQRTLLLSSDDEEGFEWAAGKLKLERNVESRRPSLNKSIFSTSSCYNLSSDEELDDKMTPTNTSKNLSESVLSSSEESFLETPRPLHLHISTDSSTNRKHNEPKKSFFKDSIASTLCPFPSSSGEKLDSKIVPTNILLKHVEREPSSGAFLLETPKSLHVETPIDTLSNGKYNESKSLSSKVFVVGTSSPFLLPFDEGADAELTSSKSLCKNAFGGGDLSSDESLLETPKPLSGAIAIDSLPKEVLFLERDIKNCSDVNLIPTPALPVLNSIGGKLYPDLRHHFIKMLMSRTLKQRRIASHRGDFDVTVRAIVVLALRDHPIRTSYATKAIKGIGPELCDFLTEETRGVSNNLLYFPSDGKFSSVAAAALVAMLHHVEENPHDVLCSMEELIAKVNVLTDDEKLDKSTNYYLERDNIDPNWRSIEKLCCENIHAEIPQCMKIRKNKKKCDSGVVFELLPGGRHVATELRKSCNHQHGPLRQLASKYVSAEYGHVTMGVDFREGGGGKVSLHKMCNMLDEIKVPFVVRELKISDYVFFVNNRLAPVLIERKSVDDVANSLSDGRWKRQQRAMRKAQFVLGGPSRRCQICYLIEGDASRRTVHGGKVGRTSWNQSLEDVENAIEQLASYGFGVMKTKSQMHSMAILSKVAKDVAWKFHNGSIDVLYTYEEFLKQVKNCDEREGDPQREPDKKQGPAAPVFAYTERRTSPQTMNHDDKINQEYVGEKGSVQQETLAKKSIADLKKMCKEREEKCSGTKQELIRRLLMPRKSEILISRKRRQQYVPKVPSCNAALLIGLLLNHRPGAVGLTKESLMMYAEETGVSKESMGGNGGFYDGWAGMKDLVTGDPALVVVRKKMYSLTTNPTGSAGVDVAKALHSLAHRQDINVCNCGKHSLVL